MSNLLFTSSASVPSRMPQLRLVAPPPSEPQARRDECLEGADVVRLGARERVAVSLARTDRKASLRGQGRLSRLSLICFGFPRRPNRLADPRLEGLRRYAVARAHDSERSATVEREHLLQLGFSERQVATVATMVDRLRPKPARGSWRIIPRAIFAWLCLSSSGQTDESILTAIALVTAIAASILAWVSTRILPIWLRTRAALTLGSEICLSTDR